jgi:hypothetical protein
MGRECKQTLRDNLIQSGLGSEEKRIIAAGFSN